jgi:alkanesulfonate monooxygenase SsuD/methylene tetrahydromethanopterin reductase-like flavin-dependent oxidoreductase (luciferase family)
LPATIPEAQPSVILEWAKRADAGPFSSLGIIDRLVYPNFEPLVTLGAVAAVTRRVRLMTAILLAPLRPPGVLAKEVATLDALSGGRVTLGLGVGRREDDFLAAPAPMKGRGRQIEAQIALMKRVWSGQAVGDAVGPMGPRPSQAGGPPILLGGAAPAAVARAGRLADGYIGGGAGGPAGAASLYRQAEEAWRAAGRPGKPRFAGLAFFTLGPQGPERAAPYLRSYYRGPAGEAQMQALLSTPEKVRAAIRAFADVGMDELILFPGVAEVEQLARLADVIG